MTGEPEIVVPEVTEPPAPIVPAPLPELRYEYQPTDEKGRPLGGKQVIKYKTSDELAEKLRDQNIELVRKLRQVTRNQRLGIQENENLPVDAERLPRTFEFKEQPLSVEERFSISQDLNNPEKFIEARDRLLESALGAKPSDLRDTLNQQQFTTNQLLARANASVFLERHPEFYQCEDNLETVTDWMIKNGLQPTVKNFEIAHSKMQEAGLLLESPIVREEAPKPVAVPLAPVENTLPNPQATTEPVARISEEELSQAKRQARVPSGLNSRMASNTVVVTTENGALTLADIDRMSSDEYGRRIKTDKNFVQLVEKLESSRPPRPR